MDRNEISILYRGSSIDASYQVSVHLAEGFQRRRLKCEKLTDDRRRMPSDGKSSLCLWQGELKMANDSYFDFYGANLNGGKKSLKGSLVPIYNAACMPVLLAVKYSAELNKYVLLVRVFCKKYRFRGQTNFGKFTSPLNWYFSQISLTNRIYLYINSV